MVICGLVEQYWDRLYPPPERVRARVGLFEWLAERAARTLSAPTATTTEGNPAIAVEEVLDALSDVLARKLPGGIAFGDLQRLVRALAESERQAEAARQQATAPPAAVVPTPVAAVQPDSQPHQTPPLPPAPAAAIELPAIPAIAADANAERAFLTLREAIRSTALSILGADFTEPRAYMLLRAATWLGITQPPPARDRRTDIPPPPGQRLAEFAVLQSGGNPQELVVALERFCSGSGIFWLDGQRLSYTALLRLGGRHEVCARAILSGLAAFLARVPGVVERCFSDGTPFADPATRLWLANELKSDQDQTSATFPGEAAPWNEALNEARASAVGGRLESALTRLATGASMAASGRDRFFWRLSLARLCAETGATPLALATLRHLNDLVDRHDLEAWEPAAVAECACLLHDCLTNRQTSGPAKTPDGLMVVEAVLARLIRNDPVMAARALGLTQSN